jgi:hypothetical protein
MKLQRYNPVDMTLLEDFVTGINFGTVYQANYCEVAQVVLPVVTTESSLTEMKVFLQSSGPFTKSTFKSFHSPSPITGIVPGSAYLSDQFTVVGSPELTGLGGVSLQEGEYLWLDVKTGPYEMGSYGGINYRFVFEYV